jgi:predicted component of type VI protein secretion system
MSMFNYGIGGNEVKIDANEAIADIPSNRTLLVQKLTNDLPVSPEAIYDLKTVEEVFEKFKPNLELEFTQEDGSNLKESMTFKNLEDFGSKAIKENSPFLNKLSTEKEQAYKIVKQLSSNRGLIKAVQDPAVKDAIIELLLNTKNEIIASKQKSQN